MSLHTIVYASSAVSIPTLAQLNKLLAAARESNLQAGLTGMLLYHDGNFMQCLEGPEETLRTTYGRICVDPGHRGVTTLIDEQIEERCFADWQMGFLQPTSQEWKGLTAANWTRTAASGQKAEQSDGYELLKQFSQLAR
jgi:hypothetical protein